MKIHPFSLQFRDSFRNQNHTFTSRDGFLVQLSRDGQTGFGEVSPLPGYSDENLEQAEEQLRGLRREIDFEDLLDQEAENSIAELLALDLHPSVECGVAAAVLDLQARFRELPLYRFMRHRPVRNIQCNAVVGMQTINRTRDEVSRRCQEGFKRIKLKLGRTSFGDDLKHLQAAARSAHPGVRFRLDANGGWNFQDAVRSLNMLSDFPVDYVEQPLPAEQINQLNRLQTGSPLSIAIDESIQHIQSWSSFFEHSSITVLVIKPTVHGLFFLSPKFQKLVQRYNIRVVLSSSFESPVGHAFLCQLAAAVNPDEFHGLATLNLFQDLPGADQGYPLTGGNIRLPDKPGLGLEPAL